MVTKQKFTFINVFKQDFLILANFLECWQFGRLQRFGNQELQGSSSEVADPALF